MRSDKKIQLRRKRHWRIRQRISGTSERPRMSVKFTNQHIYVQFIDDVAGVTLASASTRSTICKTGAKAGANRLTAATIGKLAAESAKAKGVEKVVFDRGAARYHWASKGDKSAAFHGKLATLAEAARSAGLVF